MGSAKPSSLTSGSFHAVFLILVAHSVNCKWCKMRTMMNDQMTELENYRQFEAGLSDNRDLRLFREALCVAFFYRDRATHYVALKQPDSTWIKLSPDAFKVHWMHKGWSHDGKLTLADRFLGDYHRGQDALPHLDPTDAPDVSEETAAWLELKRAKALLKEFGASPELSKKVITEVASAYKAVKAAKAGHAALSKSTSGR